MSDETAKYHVPDDHWEDDSEPEPVTAPVEVSRHTLAVNDESDQIGRYNGIQWHFVIDEGTITACDKSHYCPGPGHTDPMGFRAWGDVPDRVQRVVLRELNVSTAPEVVDIEATEEVAEESRPSWRDEPAGRCDVCGGEVYQDDQSAADEPIRHEACAEVDNGE